MKNALIAAMAAFLLVGCSSYTETARWDPSVTTNDGEVPIASFLTQNFSYQLLWCIPLSSGLPVTSGDEDIVDDFNVKLFSDQATLDNNLVSLRYAMKRLGSNRIANLESSEDNSCVWSLFLVNRHEVRTKCKILKPRP